ncbi:MAG: HlyD family efflux transporter periplasmic adaptor subunit [Planctomycetota bacterium]
MMAEQDLDPQTVSDTRREIGRLVVEVEQIANQDIPPGEFYAEFLRRVQTALAARASAIWLKTPNGNLQLQYQINMQSVGLDADEFVKQAHIDLLRRSVTNGKPALVPPHSGPGIESEGINPPNPVPFLLVLAPVVVENENLGLIEVFQDANRRASAQQGYLSFLTRMAGEVAKYLKNQRYRRILHQSEKWDQVEAYIRAVHGGLNPKQVSYLIANEAKKLIGCERVSVALKRGRKTIIEAISGQDIVEKRSNLVERMSKLAGAVIKHGDNLVYAGTIGEHWPRDVVQALESYLEESGSKLLVVVPMIDVREFGVHGKAAAAVVVEMIEDSAEPEEMGARVEVVTRHGASALYNALEYHRVFLLPVWRAIGNSTQWLNASSMPKVVVGLVLAIVLVAFLALFPWDLKLEGRGELVPKTRRTVFAPVTGTVREVKIDHGDPTEENSPLAQMSNPEMERELLRLQGEYTTALQVLRALEADRKVRGAFDAELGGKINEQKQVADGLQQQIALQRARMQDLGVVSPIRGRVMDWKPKEKLLNRPVQQGDPLLEVADVEGPWILEVQFPESAVTHIARAKQERGSEDLDVTFVLSSSPDKTYHGKLLEVSTQAQPVEQENIVEAKIVLDEDEDLRRMIYEGGKLPTGLEVRAKVNCGPHALGYVLFREVIDFVREYVFF